MAAVVGAKRVIERFTFRRVIAGAVVFGLFAAAESAAQAAGIVAAYPDAAERAKVVQGLAENAALGLFYGNRHADILSPGGYMEYRILPAIALIGAVWGLLFITKMLRGQEENGRWELLLTGQTAAPRATARTLRGAAGGLLIIYALTVFILLAVGHSPKFSLPAGSCLLYGLVVIAGAALAMAIGAVTSQLAATRRRAVLYGLSVIIPLFVIRSIGTAVDSLAWLKNFTPFGWIDKVQPFYHSQPRWLLLLAVLTIVCAAVGVWLAAKRDVDESFIADSDTAKPHFTLLNSPLGFHFRLTRTVLFSWLLAAVSFAIIVAAVVKTVVSALSTTSALTETFGNLSGNPTAGLALAYLSAASYLLVTILMVMVATSMGAARGEEASGRLDNVVSGTVSRRRWLSTRLVLIIGGATAITIIANFAVWAVAKTQDIPVGFVSLVFGGLNVLGPVMLLLGVGVLLYGLLPKFTSLAMYIVIAWSFTVDIVASIVKMNDVVAGTSLLHHVSLVPAATPDWLTFSVMTAIGLALMAAGVLAFERRDLEAE